VLDTITDIESRAVRLGTAATKFMLASGVVGTIAWCGVLTYAALVLVW
jgi:hypothetical protein